MRRPNGIVVYRGPSMLSDPSNGIGIGDPIVAILTGIVRPSTNVKTGPMLQLWILRADMSPSEALKTGADAAICGTCPLRGLLGKGRICYVQLRAPMAVWRCWKRGGYAPESAEGTAEAVRASADTSDDADDAHALGYRTFRVASEASEDPRPGEIGCPAAAENGARTTCDRCSLCSGTSRRAKSIVIRAHGSGAVYFERVSADA